jgi:hypothetical protein
MRLGFQINLFLTRSTKLSVPSVAFLCVLCVKFRKAKTKMCLRCKHFEG